MCYNEIHMYYVYILQSIKNNGLYIGFTNDLRRRFKEHNDGKSDYTRKFMPWKLIYYEAYLSRKDATRRERQLKKHAKAWGQLKGRIKDSINKS